MIGDDHVAIAVTVDGASGRYGVSSADKESVAGPALYARQTDSPYKALPFFTNAVISNPTNTTNATVDVPTADVKKYAVNDVCTFYDDSGSALSSESLTISGISSATITFTGVWTTPPIAGDRLVLADGTQLSKNVVVISDDIDFDGSTDFAQNAYIEGAWIKGQVGRTTYFVEADNQNIQLLNMV